MLNRYLRRKTALVLLLYAWSSLFSQSTTITGITVDAMTKKPLEAVEVRIASSNKLIRTNEKGKFRFSANISENTILIFNRPGYQTSMIPLEAINQEVDLGVIYMEIDLEEFHDHNLTIISEADMSNDNANSTNIGFLNASSDLLARRAAFDFSPVFFKIRGYDSRSGILLINGIPMNRMLSGRPQWNNWGGLNDVFRNQEVSLGLQYSVRHFGDVLGVTNIDTRPGGIRPGFRFSTSLTNRTYRGRIMATYNTPPENNGWGYTISASLRWARSAYIEGSPYEAKSVYSALEYQFNDENSIYMTAFLASNLRGRNSAITEEVFELTGRKYNPFWGIQGSKARSSRIRRINEPIVMLNYSHRSRLLDIEAGISYQWGSQRNSRLGYYNAPNPQPDYYRYLPSYYINSPIGANFIGAGTARESFIVNPQINWSVLYEVNQSIETEGRASYILYDDVAEENIIRAQLNGNFKFGKYAYFDLGFNLNSVGAKYYALISDLFSADFHEDFDPFSETRNQIDGEILREEGDIFGYHYNMNTRVFNAFSQIRFTWKKWHGFASAKYYNYNTRRNGFFRNERYPSNSIGQSKDIRFANYGIKGGITYELTKRHLFSTHALFAFRPPALANTFISPRENNEIVPGLNDEKISSIDIGYRFQLPSFSGRISSYYTRFQHTTSINFFYVESGLGADFVQQVSTGLDRLHMGIECALIYRPSSAITLTAATSISKHRYASQPNIAINFDTADVTEDLINVEGQQDLGYADIKDYKLSQGPAQAISLGIEYRGSKYWWAGTTFNRLSENYIGISPITRTKSFLINPETGVPFENVSEEKIDKLLAQESLEDVYIINLTAGKTWIVGRKYLSIFASINNLFDTVFRSGGYEQSRNGNYGQLVNDNLSGNPSFGPKYWYGHGRTFFINMAISFK